MDNTKRAIYKMNFDCGRDGNLTGVFIAQKNHIEILINHKIKVYFGEALGKHSDVYGSIDREEITLLTDDESAIKIVEQYNLENGYNPFHYQSFNEEREDFEDLSILEIVKILEKESKQ